ncbi:MAG TPA: hypothetical protein VGH80_05350 [Xanthomonadaceae bacterium]
MVAVLATVALVYWPLHLAGFVWVDKICFHDEAWLRSGDAWKHLIFHGFYEWLIYFRPLVVALFAFEVRMMGGTPGPMHLVSLGLHLANIVLVGSLAMRLRGDRPATRADRLRAGLAMLLFGLHPAMVEPVSWISCQFEIVVTFFVLAGLRLHASSLPPTPRAIAVASCFFLAACSKESAVSFLPLLLLQDWMLRERQQPGETIAAILRDLWRDRGGTYALVFAAGLVYLVLRRESLGFLLTPDGHESLLTFARFQTVCYVYLTYWRILVWPMAGLSPLHVVDEHRFAAVNVASLGIDLAALVLFAAAFVLALRRRSIGAVLLAVTLALLPVLHIIPVGFDPSLYHERYAMTALAVACPWLVQAWDELANVQAWKRWKQAAAAVLAAAWFGLAILNIRVTLPLWSNELLLWQWVLQEDPHSIVATAHLLSSYMNVGDYHHARALADRVVDERLPCKNCLSNAAFIYLAAGNQERAAMVIDRIGRLPGLTRDNDLLESYVLALGQLRQLRNDFAGAEQAYQDAMSLHPFDPQPAMQLAFLYAQLNREGEGRKALARAQELSPPADRIWRRHRFDEALARTARSRATPVR